MKISMLEKSDKERGAQLEWPDDAIFPGMSLKYIQDGYAQYAR
jgi:hypothetical protein